MMFLLFEPTFGVHQKSKTKLIYIEAMEEGSQPSKKKKARSGLPPFPLNPALVSQVKSVEESYSKAMPYPHGRLMDLMAPSALKAIMREVKDNLKGTYKESDLFKFYQTIDIGNLTHAVNPDLCEKMPELMRLKVSASFSSASSAPSSAPQNNCRYIVNTHPWADFAALPPSPAAFRRLPCTAASGDPSLSACAACHPKL